MVRPVSCVDGYKLFRLGIEIRQLAMVLSGRLGVLTGIGRVGLLGHSGRGRLPTLIHLYAVSPFRVVCFVLISDDLCYPNPALVIHHRIVWRRDAVIRRPGVKSFLFVKAWL